MSALKLFLKHITIAVLSASFGLLAGCGGASPPVPPTTPAAPSATKFTVTAPSTATSGAPFTFTVAAQDSAGNPVTSYNGTVHFASTDAAAALPVNTALVNGTGSFTAIFNTAGAQTISVADTANSAVTGTSGPINVASNAAAKFRVTAPSSATPGTPFTFTVVAQDSAGNPVTSYNGTAHFTSTDAAAALPANTALVNGAGSFSATLSTSGSQTIRATDTLNAGLTGTSGPIAVGNSAPKLTSLSPSSITAGAADFTLTVNGANFTSGATVDWNSTVRATTFVNSGQLTATITAADVASSGTAQVTVQNPDLTTSSSLTFTINAPAPPGGVVALISANDAGAEANNQSFNPYLSNDGRYVAFGSGATDVLAPVDNFGNNTYVRDNCVGPTAPASCTPIVVRTDLSDSNALPFSGVSGGDSFTAVSSDGQVAYFGALSQDTFPSFDPFPATLFGRITCLGLPSGCTPSTFITSLTSTGAKPNLGIADLSPISMSDDGRFVGFIDSATNMTPDPILASPANDLEFFIRDTCIGAPAGCTPTTILASQSTAGDSANNRVFMPRLSGNGRFAVFNSVATNLVAGVVSGNVHTFLRDTCIGAPAGCTPSTILIDVPFDGSAEPNSAVEGSDPSSVSDDGRYVLFASDAGNLVAPGGPPAGGRFQVYLRDTCIGGPAGCTPSTQLVSVPGGPLQTSFTNLRVFQGLSADGRYAAFQSTNVVTLGVIFVRDTCIGAPAGCTPSVSIASSDPRGIAGANPAWGTKAYLSRDGHFIALTRVNGANQQLFLARTGF